jgi:hypothetical protein
MYETDAFKKREQALEDEFFHRVDEKLREELRQSIARDESRGALVEATGLTDAALLDELIDAGFQATTLAALSLVPAIFVAWADDKIDKPERETLLKAASEHGMKEDGLAWQMILSWLSQRPKKSLWETWQHYAKAVAQSLSIPSSGLLAGEIVKLSTAVAQASGGVLGFGKVSNAEQRILDEILQTLKKH